MPNIAVFASGRGSNFVAIHQYLTQTASTTRLACLVTDRPSCGATEYASQQGIPIITVHYKGQDRSTVETDLIRQLNPLALNLLVFAGFMRIVGPVLIDAYPRRILNIHPSLLPRYPGAHAINESFLSPDKELGITIHYVDYGVDTGSIICQERFFRTGQESLEEIESRLHQIEHQSYPQTIEALLKIMTQEASA